MIKIDDNIYIIIMLFSDNFTQFIIIFSHFVVMKYYNVAEKNKKKIRKK